MLWELRRDSKIINLQLLNNQGIYCMYVSSGYLMLMEMNVSPAVYV